MAACFNAHVVNAFAEAQHWSSSSRAGVFFDDRSQVELLQINIFYVGVTGADRDGCGCPTKKQHCNFSCVSCEVLPTSYSVRTGNAPVRINHVRNNGNLGGPISNFLGGSTIAWTEAPTADGATTVIVESVSYTHLTLPTIYSV